jgi:quercetin dioxygenase-like cupin family protein
VQDAIERVAVQDTIERIVVAPDEGKAVDLGGLGVLFKVWGEETGGAFSIVEHPMEPGRLVPPHTHQNEHELSYVLEGEFGVRIGEREYKAGPGSYVFKPKGVPHTFWNAGTEPARLLEIIYPAGLERFFEELGALAASDPPLEYEQFEKGRAELAAKYNQHFHSEWIPELKEKYNLKVLGE